MIRFIKYLIRCIKNYNFNSGLIRCHYCGKGKKKGFALIQIRTVGTYFQHWNIDKKIGCKKNVRNADPSGIRHKKGE